MNKAPRRGEIWSICFDPAIGSEIKKTRPAVVISSDAIGKLPVKLVVPVTQWDERFSRNAWHVKLVPDSSNGLKKVSALDALQTRCVSLRRFVHGMGVISDDDMESVVAALLLIVEYEEKPLS